MAVCSHYNRPVAAARINPPVARNPRGLQMKPPPWFHPKIIPFIPVLVSFRYLDQQEKKDVRPFAVLADEAKAPEKEGIDDVVNYVFKVTASRAGELGGKLSEY